MSREPTGSWWGWNGRAEALPPKDVSFAGASGRLPARRARWLKVRTIRVRDLFG
ncbi:hypothetical protein [Streptomyces sp. NPDC057582]|uniref:hypothetical protein n=1 Tax=unclassified Streptomyces TaxID=2593676 RepID=UPI00367EC9EF